MITGINGENWPSYQAVPSYDNATVARIIAREGLLYAIEDFMGPSSIADPETRRHWVAAREALARIRAMLPEGHEDHREYHESADPLDVRGEGREGKGSATNEAKHTPGPWQARFLYRMFRRVRESPGDLLVMGEPENDWPDAVLCAAAPDMLEACQAIEAMAESMKGRGSYSELERAAIDKAIAAARKAIKGD